jgi:xanthine phosphoribosyltransferase
LTNAEFTLATLFYKRTSIVRPDLFVAETDKWIIFPWEAR